MIAFLGTESARQIGRGILGALLVAVVWELSARGLKLPAYVLPSITSIVTRIASDSSNLLAAARFTGTEALAGYALGCLVGTATAVLVR
jgi:NitT/TauT family transport system permease protein